VANEFVQMPSQSKQQAAIANIAGIKLNNRVVNVVAASPLANKDGAAISHTGNNKKTIDRIMEKENKILSDLSHLPNFRASDSHFTKEFNEFRSI
jgi:hypothetical protein